MFPSITKDSDLATDFTFSFCEKAIIAQSVRHNVIIVFFICLGVFIVSFAKVVKTDQMCKLFHKILRFEANISF
jgi:hypothetical protein